MSLSRDKLGGKALTVLNLDSAPSEDILQALLSNSAIKSAKIVRVSGG
jgi:hypothetical protein